jgi:hypothetical protein
MARKLKRRKPGFVGLKTVQALRAFYFAFKNIFTAAKGAFFGGDHCRILTQVGRVGE